MAVQTWSKVADTKFITVSTSALTMTGAPVSFTPTQLNLADAVHIQARGFDISYRYDAGTPTASNGYLLAAGQETILQGINLVTGLQVIRAAGSDATLIITLLKRGV